VTPGRHGTPHPEGPAHSATTLPFAAAAGCINDLDGEQVEGSGTVVTETRQIDADQFEANIWGEVRSLLTSPDRLRQGAQAHIATSLADAPIRSTQRATIAHRLDVLALEETGVIRTHAREQINDAQLAETLEQIRDERVTLQGHLARL